MQKISNILVTGANGALGKQALLYFTRQGIKVVAACRNAQERSLLQAFLNTNEITLPVLEADLGHEGHIERLVREAVHKAGGGLDALVNAAGVFEMVRTVDASREQVERIFTANFTSNWLLLKHLLPMMTERGFGRIVLISAAATQGPAAASMGFYVAAKSALNALVQASAAEVAGHDIRINAVLPTIIDTPRNRVDMPNADFSKWISPSALLEVISRYLQPSPATPNASLVKLG